MGDLLILDTFQAHTHKSICLYPYTIVSLQICILVLRLSRFLIDAMIYIYYMYFRCKILYRIFWHILIPMLNDLMMFVETLLIIEF